MTNSTKHKTINFSDKCCFWTIYHLHNFIESGLMHLCRCAYLRMTRYNICAKQLNRFSLLIRSRVEQYLSLFKKNFDRKKIKMIRTVLCLIFLSGCCLAANDTGKFFPQSKCLNLSLYTLWFICSLASDSFRWKNLFDSLCENFNFHYFLFYFFCFFFEQLSL